MTQIKPGKVYTKITVSQDDGEILDSKEKRIGQIFLRFESWVSNKYLPISKTDVICMEKDALSPDDHLASTTTNDDGEAVFEFEEKQGGEDDLDIYFLLKCAGKKIGSMEFKYDLSTRSLIDPLDRPGYYENYNGKTIGSKELPLVFRNSLYVSLRFEVWSKFKKKYEPVKSGVEVKMMDYDKFLLNPNDQLNGEKVTTNDNGAVTFITPEREDLDEFNPDLFFLIEKDTEILEITEEENENGVKKEVVKESIKLKNNWESIHWSSTDRLVSGYSEGYQGTQIGTQELPATFRIINEEISEVEDILTDSRSKSVQIDDLLKIEFHKDISESEWRRIGKIQKQLYQVGLFKRYGRELVEEDFKNIVEHYPKEFTDGFEGAAPFRFSDKENFYMLEAAVEYFLNYNDPRETTISDSDIQKAWKEIDLRGELLAGNQARIYSKSKPDVIKVYDNSDLSKIKTGNILILEFSIEYDKEKKSYLSRKHFLIKSVDAKKSLITIYGKPRFPSQSINSPWKVVETPNLVLIDSFGARTNLSGESGQYSSGNSRVLPLADSVDLSSINKKFDTIFIESSNGDKRYEIEEISNVAGSKSVTVDRGISLGDGDRSRWCIPSGLSGELPDLTYDLKPTNNQIRDNKDHGYDHYDGLMFVIFNGRVLNKYRWSSYTSRNRIFLLPPAGDNRTNREYGGWASSIRGNAIYEYKSEKDRSSSYRNFCFRVRDFNNYGVKKARFYFGLPNVEQERERLTGGYNPAVEDDSTTGNPSDDGSRDSNGKTGIKIHHGSTSGSTSHSGGCIVSPELSQMRSDLINLYLSLSLYSEVYISRSSRLSLDSRQGQKLSPWHVYLKKSNTYDLSVGDWDHHSVVNPKFPARFFDSLFKGKLYLIRPDERSLDPDS